MSNNIGIILTIIYAVVAWIVYHKIFSVYYSDVGQGCLKEIIVSVILGAVMAAITIAYWPVALMILIVAGFLYFKGK